MMDINETRWMMNHFEPDQIEQDSIRFVIELSKTLAVAAFGLLVLSFV